MPLVAHLGEAEESYEEGPKKLQRGTLGVRNNGGGTSSQRSSAPRQASRNYNGSRHRQTSGNGNGNANGKKRNGISLAQSYKMEVLKLKLKRGNARSWQSRVSPGQLWQPWVNLSINNPNSLCILRAPRNR
jgi:hypothetical protein